MGASGDVGETRAQDILDLPDDDDETVVAPSKDVLDYFSTLDDRLSGTQSSTNGIRTK